MKNKLLISLGLAALIALSVSIGVYAATAFKVTVNGKETKLDVKVINKVNYVPLNEFATLMGQDIKTDAKSSTITVTKKVTPVPTITPSPTPKPFTFLSGEKQVQKYLNETYLKKSPLKTVLGDIEFTFSVTENDSKFNQYDYLINFNIELLQYYDMIYTSESSIKKGDQGKQDAIKARQQIKSFLETVANDLIARLPNKKIEGMSDSSYYTYPNIQEDLNVIQDFAWANYGFVDPTSQFSDYYSPLTNYDETVLSTFLWAPVKE
jgi:hypothetical protein